jgi:hypothetical protein
MRKDLALTAMVDVIGRHIADPFPESRFKADASLLI